MEISYKNKRTEKICTNLSQAKKIMAEKEAKRLMRAINFIEAAESLEDLINYRPYNFHGLEGKMKGLYWISIGSRRSSYRLILKPLGDQVDDLFSQAKNIKIIMIKEVSKHYE